MAYQPIVTVQISLETSAVQRASFGTIMFIEDHMWFKERSRSYTSLTLSLIHISEPTRPY